MEKPTTKVSASPHSGLGRRPGVTLYREVARDIGARIGHGEYAPGSKLPPENELAHVYGVNRLTVRRALSELARANVIRTEHGVGTFVREPSVCHRVDDGHAGLAESMAARGLLVTHEPIEITAVSRRELADDIQQRLPEAWTGPLVSFRFRRLLEQVPWSLSVVIMPAEVAPDEWDGDASLSALLADNATPVVREERGFSAASADADDARWLDVKPGTPVLVVHGLNVDHDGEPVMFLKHHTRSDRAEYVTRLSPSTNRRK